MTDTNCDICQPPFKRFGKYYIMTGYDNDPDLYVLRRDDAMGGVMIEYCPLCGRKLDRTANKGISYIYKE